MDITMDKWTNISQKCDQKKKTFKRKAQLNKKIKD